MKLVLTKPIVLLICLFVCLQLFGQNTEINFESDGLILNGTLSIPENQDGPFPIVILVHGSGPSDRDQTMTLEGGNAICLYPGLINQTIRNFKDISDHLSSEGIAVLRYDKRSFTHGAILNPQEIVVDDFVTDVASAIAFCEAQPMLDREKIFLAGHSQGSSLIPIAAANHGSIKGLISLAGATTPIDTIFTEQVRFLFEDCANDPITAAAVSNQLYTQFTQIREGTFPLDQQIMLTISGNSIPQGPGSFWKSWIDISDSVITNYQSANIETLIVQGEDDFNVPVEEAIPFAILDNQETNIYPGINHFLTPSNDNRVSSEILEDIVEWVNRLKTSTENLVDNKIDFEIIKQGNLVKVSFISDATKRKIFVYDLAGKEIKRLESDLTQVEFYVPESNSPFVITVESRNDIQSQIVN